MQVFMVDITILWWDNTIRK